MPTSLLSALTQTGTVRDRSGPSSTAGARRFRLARWFGGMSLLLVAAITAAAVVLLSWFVTARMLRQEGVLTRDFVHGLLLAEAPLQRFLADPGPIPPEVEDAFRHIARIPDVLRANVYGLDRRVVWSSDPSLIGRRFGPNRELDEALDGQVAVEKVEDGPRAQVKSEHVALPAPDDLFIEIYVPVVDRDGHGVLGAIELYKNPRALREVLAGLRLYMAVGAVLAASVLFGALFGLVRRADRIMRSQERRLADNEALAAVGEMASVVAHGIRNPLAAIRSSAELVLETAPEARVEAGDIVAQCDRLGAWLREWLAYVVDAPAHAGPVALSPLVHSACAELDAQARARGIALLADLPDDLPPAHADALIVGQVLRSVLANALEALRSGGTVRVDARAGAGDIVLGVQDDGPGLARSARSSVGQPLFTTKAQGLGVGLALARRVLRRHGGRLEIADAPGTGTRVEITLRRFRGQGGGR